MLLAELWPIVGKMLAATPSTQELFNLYLDEDPAFDRLGAAGIRRYNLKGYLACFDKLPRLFVLAEAPGPWGCRFSGVPVTSEAQLDSTGFPVRGRPTSLKPEPLKEYTASIYWRVTQAAFPDVFTWNALPLHPHKSGSPMSIRTPRVSEVKKFVPLLEAMLDAMCPEAVLAMGRTAERALAWAGHPCTYVRHPSQGGARIFEQQVREVFKQLELAR